MDYEYPLLHDWSTEELVLVIAFYEAVEKAYETGIHKEKVMTAYRAFKKVVPSMAEEKTLLKEFENVSGYVAFSVLKAAKIAQDGETIKSTKR